MRPRHMNAINGANGFFAGANKVPFVLNIKQKRPDKACGALRMRCIGLRNEAQHPVSADPLGFVSQPNLQKTPAIRIKRDPAQALSGRFNLLLRMP